MYNLVEIESDIMLKEGYRSVPPSSVSHCDHFKPNECSSLTPINHPEYIRRPMNACHEQIVTYEFLRDLHLSCAIWPFLAVVLVNSAPQFGQLDFCAAPDFSR